MTCKPYAHSCTGALHRYLPPPPQTHTSIARAQGKTRLERLQWCCQRPVLAVVLEFVACNTALDHVDCSTVSQLCRTGLSLRSCWRDGVPAFKVTRITLSCPVLMQILYVSEEVEARVHAKLVCRCCCMQQKRDAHLIPCAILQASTCKAACQTVSPWALSAERSESTHVHYLLRAIPLHQAVPIQLCHCTGDMEMHVCRCQ